MMGPKWHEEIDDRDNSTWEAASPYHDDGSPFYWRLRPRISENQIERYECHDLELMDEDSPRGWPTLEEAKAAIAVRHAEIMEAEGLQPGAAPESCPYARLAAELEGTEYSAIRCPSCGAKMATHEEDHLCRMHAVAGVCTVCKRDLRPMTQAMILEDRFVIPLANMHINDDNAVNIVALCRSANHYLETGKAL